MIKRAALVAEVCNLTGQQDDRGFDDHPQHGEKRQQHERKFDGACPVFITQEAPAPERAGEPRRAGTYHLLGKAHCGGFHGANRGSPDGATKP
jgi:hypothetical protein